MHRINLKGPWDFQPLGYSSGFGSDPLPLGGAVKFPAEWRTFLSDFEGRTRFTRRFNQPTNLEPRERVDLVLDGIGGTAEIRLNQHEVGTIQAAEQTGRFDITHLLRLHNVLEIDIEWNGTSSLRGGLWAPVGLEIMIN